MPKRKHPAIEAKALSEAKREAARLLGSIGGKVKSKAKTLAARANGALGGAVKSEAKKAAARARNAKRFGERVNKLLMNPVALARITGDLTAAIGGGLATEVKD
jgi:hypothetical protein